MDVLCPLSGRSMLPCARSNCAWWDNHNAKCAILAVADLADKYDLLNPEGGHARQGCH